MSAGTGAGIGRTRSWTVASSAPPRSGNAAHGHGGRGKCESSGLTPIDRDLVVDVESGNIFHARGRSAAQVSRIWFDELIAKRLAGERVVGQRHGDLGQLRGEGPVVLRGEEPQRLDVPQ